VVLGELESGVIRSAWPERNRRRLLALVHQLELVPVDRAVALAYGAIRATLERQGTPMGANDLFTTLGRLEVHAPAAELAHLKPPERWPPQVVVCMPWIKKSK
jgi:tRNA(fMet)-specific endonuclease VapC